MSPEVLSLTASALYAELREIAVAVAARRPLGSASGSIVRKTIKGRDYLYFQVRDLIGKTRQIYLGPDDEKTQGLAGRLLSRGDADEDETLGRLHAAFVAAGGATLPTAPMRVIGAFAQAGVFGGGADASLIGTHAFHCLGNLLGVRWQAALHTHDVDFAADSAIEFGVAKPDAPAADVLEQLNMGFLPVPSLDRRSPSTSYRVRGQELRVDLLTPLVGPPAGPHFVPAFGAPAEPVRHLDYLLQGSVVGVALSAREIAVVRLPEPARFALHKLLISTLRPVVYATKAEKDRAQALQVLLALADNAAGAIDDAARDLVARGAGWSDKVVAGLAAAHKKWPDVVDALRPLLTALPEKKKPK